MVIECYLKILGVIDDKLVFKVMLYKALSPIIITTKKI